MNAMTRSNFSEVARTILILEKKRPLRDVAAAMGMEYATLYSRVIGRTPFRSEEINALLIAVPDIRLIDSLLQETHFIGVERIEANGWGNGVEAIGAALRSAQELLEVIADLHSTVGKRLNSLERGHIESHTHEAERALARLRLAIPHLSAVPAHAAA